MELFHAEPAKGLVQHLPHVKLLHMRSVPHHHHHKTSTTTAAARAAGGEPPHDVFTEVIFEIYTAKPCWGTLKLSGADIVSWSIFSDGVWNDAASFMAGQQRGSGSTLVTRKKGAEGIATDVGEDWGEGVVRSLVVKWTSEQQQGALHWPMRVRFRGQQQEGCSRMAGEQQQGSAAEDSSSSCKAGLSVELHVGYLERTAELAAVQARMPEWSTLSFEATTYISSWEF